MNQLEDPWEQWWLALGQPNIGFLWFRQPLWKPLAPAVTGKCGSGRMGRNTNGT